MIKHVHIVPIRRRGRPTVWYVYAWRGGPRVFRFVGDKLPPLPPEVISAIHTARETLTAVDPAIFRSLIREWRPDSPEWKSLAESTRKTWGRHLDLIEERWGKTPLAFWNDPRMRSKVVQWRDSRSDTARSADIGITVLRTLLEFGLLRGRVTANAAANIPTLYRNGQRAEIIWTDDDITRFTEQAVKDNKPHLVDGLRLAALTGLRREDLVTLTWDEVGEFAISKLALKRSKGKRRRATMPRIPALNALLEELSTRPRNDGVNTVLVNSYGDPWSGDGFGGSFNRVRDDAKIVHRDEETGELVRKHLHDLRGTFCTKLLTSAELTDQQVAVIMGWSSERVANIRRVYVDQSRVVIALGERLKNLSASS